MLSEEAREKIRAARTRYPESRAALLPALRIAQEELGYLPVEAMQIIAEELNVTEPDVYGTATFYSLLNHKPTGKHVISICHNLSCTLMGAEPLIDHLEKKLGVSEDEVTPDGRFS